MRRGGRDDRFGSAFRPPLAEVIGVVTAIRQQLAERAGARSRREPCDVVGISGAEQQHPPPTVIVHGIDAAEADQSLVDVVPDALVAPAIKAFAGRRTRTY